MSEVAVVVPLFEPDQECLANVMSMLEQAPVVLVRDGGASSQVLEQLRVLPGAVFLDGTDNRGIAHALNRGVRAAVAQGARVVVTFDQDSRPPPGLVQALITAEAAGPPLGVVGPDEVADMRHSSGDTDRPVPVVELMQSGMTFAVSTWHVLGGFDERLFIDGVDTDFCLRVRERGGVVASLPGAALAHQLGRGEASRVFRVGRFRPRATGHSPLRFYYMTRNRLVLLRRHGLRERAWAATTVRRTLVGHALALALERDRASYARHMAQGARDGVRGRSGRR